MDCIRCGSCQVKVIDSRPRGPRQIYRRRECLTCGKRWTTFELPAEDLPKARKENDEEYYTDY